MGAVDVIPNLTTSAKGSSGSSVVTSPGSEMMAARLAVQVACFGGIEQIIV